MTDDEQLRPLRRREHGLRGWCVDDVQLDRQSVVGTEVTLDEAFGIPGHAFLILVRARNRTLWAFCGTPDRAHAPCPHYVQHGIPPSHFLSSGEERIQGSG